MNPDLTRLGLHLRRDQREEARRRFLEAIREARSLDPADLARPFAETGRVLLPGFRGLLGLRESDPRSRELLAGLIAEFDAEIGTRLATLARALPDHGYYTMRDVIAGRGYRRVHTTALGAGALMMWSLPPLETERHWRHGIATGILTSFALSDDEVERDRVFPAGLLHHVGPLAITAASIERPANWLAPALVADIAGRLVATELGLPGWLRDALFSCELGPSGKGVLESAVGTACVAAAQLGYTLGSPVTSAADPDKVRRLRHVLAEHGGAEELDSRIKGMHLAAQGHLLTAIAMT